MKHSLLCLFISLFSLFPVSLYAQQSNFLLVEDFDTVATGSLPSGWGYSNGSSSNSWKTTENGDIDRCCHMNSTGTKSSSTLVTPVLNLSGGGYKLSFKLKKDNPTRLKIYPSNTSSGDPLSQYTTNISGWTYYIVDISSYTISNQVFSFKGEGKSDNLGGDIYIDDIHVFRNAVLDTPSGFQMAVMPTSASCSWASSANATQWQASYVLADLTTGTQTTGSQLLSSPRLDLPALNTANAYSIKVSVFAVSASGDVSDMVTYYNRFVTPCPPRALPYYTTFDSVPVNARPDCWIADLGYGVKRDVSNSAYLYWLTQESPGKWDSEQNRHSQPNRYLKLSTNKTPDNEGSVAVVMPGFVLPAGSAPVLSYSYSNLAATSDSLRVKIARMGHPGTAVLASHAGRNVNITTPSTFTRNTIDLSAYAGDTVLVSFSSNVTSSSNNCIFIDSVSLSAGCAAPVAPRVEDATRTTCRVVNPDDAVTPWQVSVVKAGRPAGSGIVLSSIAESVVVEDLVPSSAYDVCVRRLCSPTDTGAWSALTQFSTVDCAAAMPYSCDFNDTTENKEWVFTYAIIEAQQNFIGKFVIDNDTNGVYSDSLALYISTDLYNTTGHYNYQYWKGSQAHSFAYRTLRLNAAVYEFDYLWKCTTNQDNGDDFGRVFLLPADIPIKPAGTSDYRPDLSEDAIPLDPPDVKDDKLIKTHYNDLENSWNSHHSVVDMTARPGIYNMVVMWVATAGSYKDNPGFPLAVDDISVKEQTCPMPKPTAVDDYIHEQGAITVDAHGAGQTELIVAKEMLHLQTPITAHHAPDSAALRAVSSTDTFDISSLEPATYYYYMARAICGPGDTSHFTRPARFLTRCNIRHLPYSDKFDGHYGSLPNSFLENSCWASLSEVAYSSSQFDIYPQFSIYVDYNHNDNKRLKLVTDATAPLYMLMPYFDDVNHSTLSFKYQYSSAHYCGDLTVGYMTDPADTATYTVLDTAQKTNTQFYTVTLQIDTLPDGANIVFRYGPSTGTAGNNYVYIDDVDFRFRTDACSDSTGSYIIRHVYDTVQAVDRHFAELETAQVAHLEAKTRYITLVDKDNKAVRHTYDHEFRVPETVELNGREYPVEAIGDMAFRGLTNTGKMAVRLPAGVTLSDVCFRDLSSVMVIYPDAEMPRFEKSGGSASPFCVSPVYICFADTATAVEIDAISQVVAPKLSGVFNSDFYRASKPYYIDGPAAASVIFDSLPFAGTPLAVHTAAASTEFNSEEGLWVGSRADFRPEPGFRDVVTTDDSFTAHLAEEAVLYVEARTDARIRCTDNTVVNYTSTDAGHTFFAGYDSVTIEADRYRAPSWGINPSSAADRSRAESTDAILRVEHTIDQARYYWIAQPFDVRLSDVVALGAAGDTLPLLLTNMDSTTDFSCDRWAIYEYDETCRTTSRLDSAYRQLTDTTATLHAGRGYAVTVVESDAHFGGWVEARLVLPSLPGAKPIGGPEYCGFSLDHLTCSGEAWYNGWNLVGSPFLSNVPASAFGKYVNYIGPAEPDRVLQLRTDLSRVDIPPFVGFSIQTDGSQPVTVRPNVTADPTGIAVRLPDCVTLAVQSADTVGRTEDRTSLIFNPAASVDYVIGEDMSKIAQAGISLYSTGRGIRYAFRETPLPASEHHYAIGVQVGREGRYSFSIVPDMTRYDGTVYLHDSVDNQYYDLAEGAVALDLAAGTSEGRLSIVVNHIIDSTVNPFVDADFDIYVADGRLSVISRDVMTAKSELSIYDAQGRLLHSEPYSGSASYDLPTRGVYMISVRTAGSVSTRKVVF